MSLNKINNFNIKKTEKKVRSQTIIEGLKKEQNKRNRAKMFNRF